MIQVVVFDAYGTLFDVEGLAERAEALGLARSAELVRLWRSKQLEYTWLRSLLGRYEDFWAITRASLAYACEALGVSPPAQAAEALARAFLEPPASPDAVPALAGLASRGVRCCVFSNGTRAMVEAAARTSGLAAYLDGIASVDEGARCTSRTRPRTPTPARPSGSAPATPSSSPPTGSTWRGPQPSASPPPG